MSTARVVAQALQPAPAKPSDVVDSGGAQAYAELRRRVLAAGLLERAYGYYTWRTALSFFLLTVGPLLLVTLPTHASSVVLCSLLLAFGSVQVALVGHDAGHLAVFRDSRSNWALGWVCWSLVLGISFWYWYDRHNRHHVSTNDLAADPDLQWGRLVAYTDDAARTRRPRSRWFMQHQALLGPMYTFGLAFAFRVEGWSFALRRLHGRRRALEVVFLGVSLIVWTAPALVLGWGWLAMFLIGQVVAGVYLSLAVAPNHKGMPVWTAGESMSFLERQVLSSRNILPHPITDFVFGGLNYQIEHHLFPNMPRVHFGRARAIVKPFCLAHGLEYHETSALASYKLVLSELKRVGRVAAEWS